MAETILETRGLTKRFGAVVAADALSLRVRRGEVHALIGPNGAGKTTVIDQLAGELAPDSGSIHFDGRDVTRLPAYRRARLGLARTFQVSSVFETLTVEENLALAAQPRLGHSFRFWRPAWSAPDLRAAVDDLLARLELARLAGLRATALAHGDRRRLELAMALAGEPEMLLLDEPMAGTGPESSQEVAALLDGLKGRVTVLLVEHDMDVVFAVADTVTVMVGGCAIASDSPQAVRADPEVRRAYLGAQVSC